MPFLGSEFKKPREAGLGRPVCASLRAFCRTHVFLQNSECVFTGSRGGGDMTKILYHDMTNFISR